MDREAMKKRTKGFAKRVIHLRRELPGTTEARLISSQLFRAGASVGANYRAACRGRSKTRPNDPDRFQIADLKNPRSEI